MTSSNPRFSSSECFIKGNFSLKKRCLAVVTLVPRLNASSNENTTFEICSDLSNTLRNLTKIFLKPDWNLFAR